MSLNIVFNFTEANYIIKFYNHVMTNVKLRVVD